jgi:trimeric autotransporter adhesin
MKVKMRRCFCGVFCVMAVGCGSQSSTESTSNNSVTASEITSDSQLVGVTVNAHYSDILANLSDQSAGLTSLTVTGTSSSSETDSSSVLRSCVETGSTAVVTVTGTINKSKSKTSANGRVTTASSVTGSSTATRTWSRTDGTTVSCGTTKDYAKVNWKSPSGLQLVHTFTRERVQTSKVTGTKKSWDFGTTLKASGTRTSTWSANTSSSDTSTTFVRNKSIKSDVTRAFTAKDKNGDTKSLTYAIKTKDADPLVVAVERQVSDQTVVSRTISSGTLVGTKDSDNSTVTWGFKNFKVSLSSGDCKFESGTATITFADSAGTTLQSYTLTVDTSGDPVVTDSSGTLVDDFSLDACDPEDLKL